MAVRGVPRRASVRLRGVGRVLAIVFVAAAPAGCGGDGVNAMLVDPARYNGYRCVQLVQEWTALHDREKKLRNLMDKAADGGGGTVIGAMAYRSDYQTVLEQEKLVQRAAVGRKCQLAPTYTSDQSIR
jgi:hypothetical protein